jgi:hypothetical protein
MNELEAIHELRDLAGEASEEGFDIDPSALEALLDEVQETTLWYDKDRALKVLKDESILPAGDPVPHRVLDRLAEAVRPVDSVVFDRAGFIRSLPGDLQANVCEAIATLAERAIRPRYIDAV